MDTMQVQVVLGAVVAYLLQAAKKTSWFPGITEQSTKAVKVLWSAILAAFTALGLSYAWDPTAGVFTISGLTWANIWHGLITFGFSLIVQHGTYELFVKKTVANVVSAPALADLLKKLPVVILAASLLAVGCAPSYKGKLEQADRSVKGALQALDQTENDIYRAGLVTPEWHKQFSRHMVTALTAGQTFHRSVATYQPGQSIPIDVVNLAGALQSAADLVRSLPPGDTRAKIAAVLDAAAFVARELLILILPQQADVLFPVPVYAH